MKIHHVEKRVKFTKGHNREAKIFNVLFDPTKIPSDLVWKNIGGPDFYVQRTELPGLPTLCDLLGRIFVRLKIVDKPDWNVNEVKSGWRLVDVCWRRVHSFLRMPAIRTTHYLN